MDDFYGKFYEHYGIQVSPVRTVWAVAAGAATIAPVTATLAVRVRRSVAPAVVVCVRGTVASTVAAGVRVGWTVALALTRSIR